MQTLITSAQMRNADEFTINNIPIASIDLMEKAARAFVKCFMKDEFNASKSIAIFCGKGNNGGDGLAIAHILTDNGFKNVKVYILNFSNKESVDFKINLQRLNESKCKISYINTIGDLKNVKTDLIIDAILGSGLNKPLDGFYADVVKYINKLNTKIYAVDVPTGFPSEGIIPDQYNGIKALETICFQRPKINFFIPESVVATESFQVMDIGLIEDFIQKQNSDFFLIEATDIEQRLKPRKLFSHKGTYGHALIFAGSSNTMGAALLASMACLHAGAGLVTASIPASGLIALNTLLPEVMALAREEDTWKNDFKKYQAIAVGPGLGISKENTVLLENLIDTSQSLIIDADALNIVAKNPHLLERLPKNTILTPHVKEFDRLFGTHTNWYDRLQTGRLQAQKHQIIILLKNQYTFICLPDGKICINPTGCPAMAQGGMGDVLTGTIAAFIAQKYTPVDAAIVACYIHGQAGDILSQDRFVVNASLVARQLSKEIKKFIC